MRYFILLSAIFSLNSLTSSAQSYEQVYEVASYEVQNRIDANKINQRVMLSGIAAKHVIGISGISSNNKEVLQSLLQERVEVITFTISDDATSLHLECEATFTFEQIKQIITDANGIVTGTSVEYSLLN